MAHFSIQIHLNGTQQFSIQSGGKYSYMSLSSKHSTATVAMKNDAPQKGQHRAKELGVFF